MTMEPLFLNSVVYFCEPGEKPWFQPRIWNRRISTVLGAATNSSPSECFWLIPTWEAFTQAS